MDSQIFNQSVGAIICHLSNRVTGVFTTEINHSFITVNFQYQRKAYNIMIHGAENDFAAVIIDFAGSINCNKLGTCLDIEGVLSTLDSYLG